MATKDEILNIYRHAKGLFQSAERLARSEGVVRCQTCQQIHPAGTPHPQHKEVEVEHRKLKVAQHDNLTRERVAEE